MTPKASPRLKSRVLHYRQPPRAVEAVPLISSRVLSERDEARSTAVCQRALSDWARAFCLRSKLGRRTTPTRLDDHLAPTANACLDIVHRHNAVQLPAGARRRSQAAPAADQPIHEAGAPRRPVAGPRRLAHASLWRVRAVRELLSAATRARVRAGENELRHRGSELWPMAAPQVSPDNLRLAAASEQPRTPERTVSPSWGTSYDHRATSAPMPMPRISSGELCVALERVAHIAVEDNELRALSPLAPERWPSSTSSSPVQRRVPRVDGAWASQTPQHAGLAALRVAAAPGAGPPVLSPLRRPTDNHAPDGRLAAPSTVVPCRGDGRLGASQGGQAAHVRPPAPDRGPPARRPVPAPVGRGVGVAAGGRRPGRFFLLGVHNGRFKAVGVCKDSPRPIRERGRVLAGAVRGLRQRAAPGLLHVARPTQVRGRAPPSSLSR